MAAFDKVGLPSAKNAAASLTNFLKNIFPDVENFVRYLFPYPQVVHVVPDFFVVFYKFNFDYNLIENEIIKNKNVQTVKNDVMKVFAFQLNDVREFKTTMSAGKQVGTCSFVLNDPLINVDDTNITGNADEYSNREVSIDKMDLVKVFERNRFDDNYTATFTGYVTSIQHRNVPKSDFGYIYTAADITTALRLSQTVTQPSFVQLLKDGTLPDSIKKNQVWENPLLLSDDLIEIIKGIIANSSYIYPTLNEIRSIDAMPTNENFTRVQLQTPTDPKVGLLNLIHLPKDFPKIQAYGNVFKNFNTINFYQSKTKFPFDIINDMADVIGFEFYATPEGNLYFGISKRNIDIDGASYSFDENEFIFRPGFYSKDGSFDRNATATKFEQSEIDKYIINPEDFLSYDEVAPLDNIYTRVDVAPTSFGENILKSKSVLKEIFGESFVFTYPDFKFDQFDKGNFSAFNANDEKFKDLIRYGLRIFPVEGKPFLLNDQAIRAYAQFTYDKLKGMRRTATLTILPRPELVAGRTIRVPHLNLIAYVSTVTHDLKPKKSASTTLGLTFVRSSDPVNEKNPGIFTHLSDLSSVENDFGAFVPAGTFDYTLLSEGA